LLPSRTPYYLATILSRLLSTPKIHTESLPYRGRWGASPPGLVRLTSQLELGRLGCRGLVSGSAHGIKNPLPVIPLRRGVSTGAVGKPSHTARLRAGRCLPRRAPHGKGSCHTDRPTRKPEGFTPTTTPEICRAGAFLPREGQLALRARSTREKETPQAPRPRARLSWTPLPARVRRHSAATL
jgi:hypothetical protein